MAKPRILIMAGGTGGHVFPGLAVADELYQRGWQVDWLGTAERMEAQLVPKHGYPIHFIQVKGVRGNGLLRKLVSPLVLAKAVFQALKLLREVRPQVVLGMGGFASGPGGIAAKLLGIPVVLHEQNAAAGLTNRYLSKVAKHSLMAFPGALEGGQVVGNPVRSEVLALPAKHYQSANSYRVLVIGGSLGAQVLNQQLAAVVSAFKGPIEVLHQVGAGKLDDTLSAYAAVNLKPSKDLRIQEFIDDMAAAYHWADVIICRAGALTVSEVAAAGLPAIFVPLPHAVDDHQTKNANFLVDQAAAQLIAQPLLNTESLLAALEHYQNLSVRQLAADRARELAISNATTRVADICSHFGSTHE